MISQRFLGGTLAEWFGRKTQFGYDLVGALQDADIFKSGDAGGYRGSNGAIAHSADAILLLLALASGYGHKKAVEYAMRAYKLPSAANVAILSVAPGDENGAVVQDRKQEQIPNPLPCFGVHLGIIVHSLRREDDRASDNHLVAAVKEAAKFPLGVFTFGTSWLAGEAPNLYAAFNRTQFSNGEWRNLVVPYVGYHPEPVPAGKYLRGATQQWDAEILRDLASLLGPLTAETWKEDNDVDYRDANPAIDIKPVEHADAYEIALKMARGS